jgi:solute carrier family 35 protein E3
MNYCLSQSTVGFYQVAKLFCIPLTLFFETIFGLRQEALTVRLMASLAVIVLGMMMVIREEISTNFTGFVWGVCGIVTTALSQVFFGPLKKGLGLDAFQLLFHTSPWLTFGSFCMVPFFEKTDKLIEYDLTGAVVFDVLLTCLVAVAFNISNYVVLAEISPLSYNIIGHVKTIVIIGVGSYLFHTWPSTAMLMGMVTAVVGVLLYTFEKEQQQKQQPLQQSSQTDKLPAQVTRSPHGSLAALESGLGKGASNGKDNMVSNSSATASAPAGSSGSSHIAGTAQTDAAEAKAERLHKLQQQRRDAKNIEGFLRV